MLHTYHRPESLEAEAYRDVRTALYFSTRHQRHRLIQITSPHLGDGKSTLAANLAISIAKSERRVLLIDADMRRPRQHEMFGMSSNIGLVSVLTGEVELIDAIQNTPIANLSILPCGPIPDHPAELLATTYFQEFLESIREKFDFVLIDTAALLPVADPRIVAGHVDGILLALRVNKRSRLDAETAREILGALWLKVFGVVINGMTGYADAGGIGPRYYHYIAPRSSLRDGTLRRGNATGNSAIATGSSHDDDSIHHGL